jgi:KDO2-lipid IV(A) lauroyltransferase
MGELEDRTKMDPVRPNIIHYFEYFGFSAMKFAFNSLSLRNANCVSAFFWRLIAPKLKRHNRAMVNLRAAMPELSTADRTQILNAMWDNLGRTSAEALRLNEIADDPSAITLNFSDEALAIMRSEQPAIFVSLHLGNWEITAIAAEKFNKPLIGVYKKVLNPLVDAAVVLAP